MPSTEQLDFHLMAKPTGAICNLDCHYCFFLSKESLYPDSDFRMPDEVLERYIRQLLEAHTGEEVVVAWQGGEPTLMGLDFFQRSIEYVNKYRRPGQRVAHTLQTNGIKLNDNWCRFLKEHRFLVGLSLDGPREMHDTYRVDKGGQGTFDDVMRASQLLRQHDVEVNILCTVHAANQDSPLEVYRFFRDELNARYVQFIPIVERTSPELLQIANRGWRAKPHEPRPLYMQQGNLVTDRSVRAERYGSFLIAIFDEWVRRDVGTVFVQIFDAALASWAGAPATMCIFAETCGGALALEHNGDVYSCDHYVEPDFHLGNLGTTHLRELVNSAPQRRFGQAKRDTLPRYCLECPVRFACNGGCPKDRFITTPTGEAGLNYLCAGYKAFFEHIQEPMTYMAEELRHSRPPMNVMRKMHQRDADARVSELTSGGQCACGSGRPFGACHGLV